MKNALEMNKIANEVTNKLNDELTAKAKKAIDKIVEPMIEYEAKHGGFSVNCRIGTDVSIDKVVEILKENGYNVSVKYSRVLDIEWFDWNVE